MSDLTRPSAQSPPSETGSALADLQPAPRANLADNVYESLKTLLMDGAISPGSRLNIDGLARRLVVSPSPVREALARLEADRLAVKEPYRGYTASPLISADQLEDLYQFRLLIEPWAAAEAATAVSTEDFDRLKTEMDSSRAAPEGVGYDTYAQFAAHDARFHDLIFDIAGNQAVKEAFNSTHCHLHMLRLFYGSSEGNAALEEHRAIVAAVSSRDPTAAKQAMRDHLIASRTRMRVIFRDRSADSPDA